MSRETCSHCGRAQLTSGHDPCIANLPDVVFACCGHGGGQDYTGSEEWSMPYLVERVGGTLYGYPALARMRELGGSPPNFALEDVFVRGNFSAADMRRYRVS